MEVCWLDRQSDLRRAFFHSMDRLRAREEKRHTGWILGMQRARFLAPSGLFRDLSPRLSRGVERIVSSADLFAKRLLCLDPSHAETSGKRAAPAGVISGRSPASGRNGQALAQSALARYAR